MRRESALDRRWIPAVFGTCLLLSALGCDDDEGNNEACERGCADDYLVAVDSCEEDATSCMGGCSAPDDVSCMWDCEDLEAECDFEMIMCMSGCPCMEASQSCISGCGQEDMDCFQACGNNYMDCAGPESPYTCITMCSPEKYGCVWDCEETAVDMPAYLDCRVDCHQAFTGCLADCT